MSVIIKGMKLPQHADVNGDKDTVYRCAILVNADNSVDLVVDAAFASAYDNGHNIQRYPFTEIPTPHGRLIDADKMLKAIEVMKKNECKTCSSRIDTKRCNRNGCWMMFMSDFINSLPTVIEAEHESEARKWARVGGEISKGLQEGIEVIKAEVKE